MRLPRFEQVLVRQLCAAVLNRQARSAPKAIILGLVVALAAGVFGLSATAKASLYNPFSQQLRATEKTIIQSANRLAAHAGLPAMLARDTSANAVATLSAASFEAGAAPDSIVASFGQSLATQTASATTVPLPTQLGGTTVEVNGVRAGLFFVSAGQINYQIPSTTALGTANVVIRSGDGIVSNGTVQVVQVMPGIFSANGNGRNAAAAVFLRVKSNGTQIYEAATQFNVTAGRMVTRPVDLGPITDRVFLVLFATGLRYFEPPAKDSVSILIGGEQREPFSISPSPALVGVDQVNVEIPRTLIGRGVVSVSASATGFSSSNLVDIEIAGNGTGPSAPQIVSLMPQQGIDNKAVAGRSLIITGSGFSADKTANKVYIGPGATEAQVMTASTTQLEVVVPFGVETGTVKVATPNGEGVSASPVPIITSISGIVENTNRQPLAGVNVRLSNGAPPVTTSTDGTFVLANVPATAHSVFIDGDLIPTQPPYPKLTMKIVASANRDNKFASPIALQQATGASGTIGSGSSATEGGSNLRVMSSAQQQQQPTPQPATTNIQTGNFSLQVAANAKPVFPDGSSSGKIYLTPVQNGRTPVELPMGVYSSSIVQVTPFDTKVPEGAKLVLPNDGRPIGASLKLYRYDNSVGKFVEVEGARVAVSADGKLIETGPTDVKEASIYFAAPASTGPVPNATTTVQGRVLCCVNANGQVVGERAEPVGKASVKARGQEAETDGNGSYILRNVPAAAGQNITVDVTYRLPNGRVARAQSPDARIIVGGITVVGPTYLPSESLNRVPVILAPPKVEIPVALPTEVGTDIGLVISDPDPGQQVTARVTGETWASLIKVQGTGSIVNANAYILRLKPPSRGVFRLTVTADDNQGGTAVHNLDVSVAEQNRPPTATPQDLATDEDTPLVLRLAGSDLDGNALTYRIVTPPLNGGLSGTAPNLTYVPIANFNGSDIFTFVVNDGSVNSAQATVKITVRPVNDAPVLTVPATVTGSEGQPLTINLTATDVDLGQTLTFTGSNLPTSASVVATSATSSQFKWTPNFTQAGSYTITIRVSDNGIPPLSDTKEIKVNIVDVSTLSVPGPQTVNEGQQLIFDVAVPSGQASPIVNASNLPEGATLTAAGAGVWQFKWTPSYTQAGSYAITFRATTNGGGESKEVRVSVYEAHREFSKEPGDFVVYGANGPAPRNVLDAGDAIGTSVITGDLNGDGIADLVIGAPTANNGIEDVGRDTGAVYIFFGKASLGGTLDLAQQKPDVTLFGERSYDAFGASLAIGDISGDGKPDLIIGAPLADTTDRRDCGKVYVLFGAFPPDGLDANKAAIITRIVSSTLNGLKAGDKLGTSVAIGRFRSKTGVSDLLVGAPGVDVRSELLDQAITDAGSVYLFAGGTALSRELDLAKAANAYTLLGDVLLGGGQLGSSLAVGDFNGDEYADFAVGAPFANGANKATGYAYLVLGSAGLTGTRTATLLNVGLFLSGTNENDNLGTTVALSDINGDGFADFIMGAPGGDGPNNSRPNTGEVLIFYGAAGIQAKTSVVYGAGRAGDAFADALGSSLAAGDFNGDGIADLVLGAPGADLSSDKREPVGAAYLLFGTRTSLPSTYDLATKAADLTIYGAFPGDRLGAGSFALGNLNGSETAELVLGIPRSASVNNARTDAGEVRVLNGVRR